MNAPTGVDTDSSGEDFTPPPSPKPEQAKPSFSLISAIFPTKRSKKDKDKIKAQTPEQAAETRLTDLPTHSRLRKKRVRIAEAQSEEAVTPVDLVDPVLALDVQLDAPESKSNQVIEVLRQLLVKNTLDDSEPDGIPEPEELAEASGRVDPIPPAQQQQPAPDTPKRRPSGLDLSGFFKSSRRQKHKPARLDQAGGVLDSITTPDTQTTPATNGFTQNTPSWLWKVLEQMKSQTTAPPSTTGMSLHPSQPGGPPWPNAPRVPSPQSHPYAAYAHPAYPHPYYPPYPPVYPHPSSLQPWQPYYPYYSPQQPGSDGRNGIIPPGFSGSESAASPLERLRNPWSPHVGATRADILSSGATDEGLQAGTDRVPETKTLHTHAKTPKPLKPASIAHSERPEQGETGKKIRRGAVEEGKSQKNRAETHARPAQEPPGRLSSSKPKETTWAQCLLSLASCIHLCESLTRHIKREDGDSHPLQRVIPKLLAGLIMQRDIVQDMQSLFGDTHGDEVARFAGELQVIKSFLGHCIKKRSRSKRDSKRLSQMHQEASRALETGGLEHLLPQAFRFADLLTPAVIKALIALVHDWLDHKLSVKGVMKSLLVIQHEVKEVQRSREKESPQVSDKVEKSWPIMRSLDLIYRLFASDPENATGDSIPGAWPAESPSEGAISAPLPHSPFSHNKNEPSIHPQETRSHHLGRDRADKNVRDATKGDRKPHRGPKEVLSDLMHTKKDEKPDDEGPSTRTGRRDRVQDSGQRRDGADPAPSTPATSRLPSAKEATVPAYSTPPLRVSKRKTGLAGPDEAPSTPLSPDSPQSSPSQYSQHESEVAPVGTVSSDDEAKSLLAQADSGPPRRKGSEALTADAIAKERVSGAREVLRGNRQ